MKILAVDGHNLLYRSFVSVPQAVTGRDSRPINGVYGMLSVLIRLVTEIKPDAVVAAFDTPEVPTFRHELYPPYQGHRGPLGGEHAAEFQRQTEIARAILPTVNIPALRMPRYEADDIMATIALRALPSGGETTIVSTDRDLLQIVRPGVDVLVPGKRFLPMADAEAVRARLGVAPEGVTTWKALAGDASDNIPGVRGIGTKTAAALVNEFGTLEAIYEHLDDLPPRQRQALEEQRDDAFLFRRVVTLVSNLELPVAIGEMQPPAIVPSSRARQILDAADEPAGERQSGTPGGIRTPDL